MNNSRVLTENSSLTPIPERCTLITDLIGQNFALSFFIATFASETISIAGGDACVPGLFFNRRGRLRTRTLLDFYGGLPTQLPKTPPPTILPNLCKGIVRSKEYIRVYETNSLFIGGLVEPAVWFNFYKSEHNNGDKDTGGVLFRHGHNARRGAADSRIDRCGLV